MAKAVEFRGCDNLVIAEVTVDDNENYTPGSVEELAPVGEISKTVETSSEAKYYDNKAMIVINSEGADTVTFTVPALPLDKLAKITGKTVDESTGAFIDGERTEKYFAVGYRLKKTDGTYRYVWRYKGSFNIPDETSATENNGTDSNNQQLTFTGISTTHKFAKGGSAKAMVVDESDGKADLTTFFSTVTTPDDIKAKSAA